MNLDKEDEMILAGEYGETRQKMMEILVALGKVFGAESLVPITSAQISGASYKTIGKWGLEWLSNLDAKVAVPSVLNPIGMPRENWQDIGIPKDFADSQNEVMEGKEDNNLITGIIHGDLDVDRMDYLLRDAHYTGAPYGTVDVHRLIRNTTLGEKGLVLRENGINAAESLLIARTIMRPSVYFHHVSRIAETMVTYAALEHIEATEGKDIGELMRMNDAEFSIALSNSPSEEARKLIGMIYRRKLYKRAVYIGMDQVKYSTAQKFVELKDKKSIAEKVCKEAGLDRTEVLVDIPPFPSPMKIDVLVRNHNELVSLEELSPLIRTLNMTRKSEWRMGIYTSSENRKTVEQCAYDLLNIERPTKQDKLVF